MLEAIVLAGLTARLKRFGAAAVLGLAAAAVGFAGGLVFERRPPAGFPLSLLGQGLAVQRDRARAQAAANLALATTNAANWSAMRAARDGWMRAHGQCEAARLAERGAAAGKVASAYGLRGRQSDEAFSRGYRAGRTAGQLTCGGDDATPDGGPDLGVGDLDGELQPLPTADDFADRWAVAAYRPGEAVRP